MLGRCWEDAGNRVMEILEYLAGRAATGARPSLLFLSAAFLRSHLDREYCFGRPSPSKFAATERWKVRGSCASSLPARRSLRDGRFPARPAPQAPASAGVAVVSVGVGSRAPAADGLDERFAHEYGPWRPVVGQVADKFLACGILEHGFARIRTNGDSDNAARTCCIAMRGIPEG